MAEWVQIHDKNCPSQKSQKLIKIFRSVSCLSTTPANDRLAPSSHGVDKSGDTLLCNGIPLNLQKMWQVSQVAVGVDLSFVSELGLRWVDFLWQLWSLVDHYGVDLLPDLFNGTSGVDLLWLSGKDPWF